MLKKYYLGGFFLRPYCTNSINTRLGSLVGYVQYCLKHHNCIKMD